MSHLDTGALKERAQHAEPSIALLLIVVVGASLRLWRLGTSRLNYDESFTAMTGRMPFAGLVTHLRIADSHPPLDYLLRAPLARAGVSDTFVRLPSALCSIAALVLFAWWMRTYGRAGVFAVVLMAVSAFQIAHGREARMYAELQLIGVATAVLVDTWLRAPRRRHPFIAGTLTALALLTHVSGMLLVAGLLLVPGRRRDRDAWRWRAAVGLGAFVWAALWGPSFLVQARGGHSQWIPHSTASRAVAVVASLVTPSSAVALLVMAAIVAGAVVMRRRDHVLTHTWMCCFAAPTLFAVALGRFLPVLLDRTLSLFAWGAPFAAAIALDALLPSGIAAGGVAFAAVLAVMMPGALHAANATNAPTPALDRLSSVARPGDIVAIEPLSKLVELQWSLGVRSRHGPTRPLHLDIANTPALALTGAARSGRVWLLTFGGARPRLPSLPRCAPDWVHGTFRIRCLMFAPAAYGAHRGG